jgi:dihydroxy-acid dehydratase
MFRYAGQLSRQIPPQIGVGSIYFNGPFQQSIISQINKTDLDAQGFSINQPVPLSYNGYIYIHCCNMTFSLSIKSLSKINKPSVFVYGCNPSNILNMYGRMINGELNVDNTMRSPNHIMAETLGISPLNSSIYDDVIVNDIKRVLIQKILPTDIITKQSIMNTISATYMVYNSEQLNDDIQNIAALFNIKITTEEINLLCKDVEYLKITNKTKNYPEILKILLDNNMIDGTAYTITGKTMGENIKLLNSFMN